MTSESAPGEPSLARRLRRNVRDCVRIDTRSLAVFRVLMGALLFADVLLRSRNFSFYYTDDGVMPQSLAMEMTPDNAFSVFFFTSDPTVIAGLFVLQALVAIQLIVGYKTRIATVLAFLLVISTDYHNPAVTSYADVLYRLLLFWAIFLPLGERWSVDAAHADGPPRASVAGVASALILLQMFYMYFYNGYHKLEDEIWHTGEAAPKVLGLDDMTFLAAEYIREFPLLLQLGGATWFIMLLGSGLLIVLVGRPRMAVVGMFMIGHFSFAITVRIGAFAFVAMAALVLFLQAQFWDDGKRVLERLGVDDGRVRLLERASSLERVAASVPRFRIDDERYRRAKSGVYTVSLVVIIVSVALVLAATHTPLGTVGAVDDTADSVDDTLSVVNADQPDWTVFAPTPRTTDRYYVFAAKTVDGDRIDVYNDRPLTYDRPGQELQQQYSTYRERFYMNSVRRHANDERANGAHIELAEHYCTTWADENDVELTHLNMYQVSEDVTLETITTPEDRETWTSELYQHGCGDNEPTEIEPPE
ncbi:HTTM domain-containing protein [Natrarchaeobaculum sulfurireducens]|uniref:HTTM domain-containing protein n=1 Tax=Natrarchaeobaculum sulfurireducens TaxID=2044521 RepID=UPI000E3EC1B9